MRPRLLPSSLLLLLSLLPHASPSRTTPHRPRQSASACDFYYCPSHGGSPLDGLDQGYQLGSLYECAYGAGGASGTCYYSAGSGDYEGGPCDSGSAGVCVTPASCSDGTFTACPDLGSPWTQLSPSSDSGTLECSYEDETGDEVFCNYSESNGRISISYVSSNNADALYCPPRAACVVNTPPPVCDFYYCPSYGGSPLAGLDQGYQLGSLYECAYGAGGSSGTCYYSAASGEYQGGPCDSGLTGVCVQPASCSDGTFSACPDLGSPWTQLSPSSDSGTLECTYDDGTSDAVFCNYSESNGRISISYVSSNSPDALYCPPRAGCVVTVTPPDKRGLRARSGQVEVDAEDAYQPW